MEKSGCKHLMAIVQTGILEHEEERTLLQQLSHEARHIDEKLFLELCAAPPVPEAKTARQRR